VVGVLLLVNNSVRKIEKFTRVDIADGSKTVQFERTGDYVGYYETPTDASPRAFVRMQITDSSGTPITLHLYGSNTHLTYTQGGRHGEALFTFTISKSGRYLVQVRSADAAPGSDVALGESIAHGLVAGVLTLIPGVLLVIAAIVLLIVGLVRRSGHKRELRRYPDGPPPTHSWGPAPGYPSGPPPAGYGGPPPPGWHPGGYPPGPPPPPSSG
jgi:hypothetical protein